MKKPEIEQYLMTSCALIMDELNLEYREIFKGDKAKENLKSMVNERFSETDLSLRLGYPFRQMVHYNVVDSTGTTLSTKNHDLLVESKGYKMEVKFLKNWKSEIKTSSNSKMWSEFQRDFDWIIAELKTGSKGKCAFVIGWFNCVDHFSEVVQLGERINGKRTGGKPLASERKVRYFPFLKKTKEPAYTKDLTYDYLCAYDALRVELIDQVSTGLNCIFMGEETDVFHFAIYY